MKSCMTADTLSEVNMIDLQSLQWALNLMVILLYSSASAI